MSSEKSDILDKVDVLREVFPLIFDQEAQEAILNQSTYREFKEGELLIDIGQYIKFVPLVVRGLIKIVREDKEGNELQLYYLKPGETCAMSLTCCSAESTSKIRAVVEEDADCFLIPTRLLDEWTEKFPSFKNFVLTTYQKRFEELLATIDGLAFQKMDERLLHILKEKSAMLKSNTIPVTHLQLAEELHSSREVVSRVLKQMELKNMVKLGRQRIELTI